jgi:hypothetical protein
LALEKEMAHLEESITEQEEKIDNLENEMTLKRETIE